jgi:hypothetical protein
MTCGTLDCSFEAKLSAELTFPEETTATIDQEELWIEVQEAVANSLRVPMEEESGDDDDEDSSYVEISSIRDGSAIVDLNIWFNTEVTAQNFLTAVNASGGLDIQYRNSSYLVTYGEVQLVFVIDAASAMTVPVFLLIALFLNF